MKKINIITQAALALSAGMLFTACHSMHRERASHETSSYSSGYGNSSMQESSGAQAYGQSSQNYSSSQSSQDRDEVVIPLHEEQLTVGKRTVDAGQVTIRKIVTTETVSQPVQLRRETADVVNFQLVEGRPGRALEQRFDVAPVTFERVRAQAALESEVVEILFQQRVRGRLRLPRGGSGFALALARHGPECHSKAVATMSPMRFR